MRLRELAPEADGDVEVADLAYDARAVAPGALFFCVPGLKHDGHDFARQAVERGAVALVVERPLGLGVPEVVVESARAAMPPLAARFFGDPSASLAVAGITGTNGKTTTAFLVRGLLEASGRQCGLLGTVTSVVGGAEREVVRTTPEAIDLQRTFAEMRDGGDSACAIEVSSHALALLRAEHVHFATAVFTNLTQDHLDFHPTMDAYFIAKRRLLELSEGARIVNLDDVYGRRLAADFPDAITYAIDQPAQLRARAIESGIDGSEFDLETEDRVLHVQIPLPGRYNIANALAALAAVRSLGVDLSDAVAALATAEGAPGRLQPVDAGQEFAVLVDYAHTPDSLDNVLRAARALTDRRVICVFGCGGDRDRGKRPQMCTIARALADHVIVTSDNPRSEDPEAIIAEITAGAHDVETEVDRRQAIERALALAGRDDVVVIAGKGHEHGQEFADGVKLPFDDVEVARSVLQAGLAAR